MKRTIIGISMLSSALIFGAHWAAQPVALANSVGQDGEEVGVGRGARLPRIAITADGKLGEVLRKNAALSSGFEVIERKSIPSSLVRAKGYDPAAWASVGADVVVIVECFHQLEHGGRRVFIEIHCGGWDATDFARFGG